MRSINIKQYGAIVFISLLIALLFELFYYPLSASQLSQAAEVKTVGSILVLTDETPQQVRIYHRAFILPRYRLKSELAVTQADFHTANEDWFQVYVVSVENHKIVLYAPKISLRPLRLLGCFVLFTICTYQTYNLIHLHQRAKNKK